MLFVPEKSLGESSCYAIYVESSRHELTFKYINMKTWIKMDEDANIRSWFKNK